MNPEHNVPWMSEGKLSPAERNEAIRRQISARDAKQSALLELLSNPNARDDELTDTWVALAMAQGDVDYLVKAEMKFRLGI